MPEETATNLARLQELLTKAESDGVTKEELQQAKNKICAHIILQSERSSSRLFSVGGNWVQRREYKPVADVVADYKKVTRDDIDAVLKKYPLNRPTTVCVGPLKELK
jgi:predicted Zn-dependent peptidase